MRWHTAWTWISEGVGLVLILTIFAGIMLSPLSAH